MATIINGDGIVTAEGTSSTQGRVRLGEDTDNGTNYVELQAPASVASNVTFTLPSADGTSGQVLQTNGSGVLSFTTPAGGFSAMQVFTSSGTFTIPAGKTTVKVYVTGGGGSGRGTGGSNTGGNSSVSSGTQTISTITGNGGQGGSVTNPAGGTASGGDLNVAGNGGGTACTDPNGITKGGAGGGSYWGGGGPGRSDITGSNAGENYGGGGSGVTTGNNAGTFSGGGGGGTAIKYLTGLTPGNTLSVTVGTGGASGTNMGGAGSNGVVVFEY